MQGPSTAESGFEADSTVDDRNPAYLHYLKDPKL